MLVKAVLISTEDGPVGFSLRHGINTILNVEKEMIPIVQVYQTSNTLAIKTEVDSPLKKIKFQSETVFKEFIANFSQLCE